MALTMALTITPWLDGGFRVAAALAVELYPALAAAFVTGGVQQRPKPAPH